MIHKATTPDRDDTEAPRTSVANPRRTRLDANGRPITVSATTSSAE
ncbi:hypothetical protein KIH74_00940 [Kineosporia sp. J2-2]|uniref:Uncharacterized protein n=1 Tax=Kineosporia corallincola TaxID=2835133 RepID=A0ABS5T8R6_9ACTN|nr:hypothetical protein [Kineosporia corallincola]MBT0767467.1 hypothetical protein [Kineosporia corallincola]